MDAFSLFQKVCIECSRNITKCYSTSFSMGIKAFDKAYRNPIYAIYAYVRFADEIVDSFHQFPKEKLFRKFREDTYEAIELKISLNPVLHSFQEVVAKFNISIDLIDAFLDSMEMDLHQHTYAEDAYKKYIYGSAEVVGLMCLKVFCDGNEDKYNSLTPAAQSLGAAFQKVNFLRDMASDFDERGRVYFPQVDFSNFTAEDKVYIEKDIQKDFDDALRGIMQLPRGVKKGVYLAYVYYLKLFKKIQTTSHLAVKNKRIRVSDSMKIMLYMSTSLRSQLNLL